MHSLYYEVGYPIQRNGVVELIERIQYRPADDSEVLENYAIQESRGGARVSKDNSFATYRTRSLDEPGVLCTCPKEITACRNVYITENVISWGRVYKLALGKGSIERISIIHNAIADSPSGNDIGKQAYDFFKQLSPTFQVLEAELEKVKAENSLLKDYNALLKQQQVK
jgi:hypothetical protein